MNGLINVTIFSKNRAAQLDLLLTSMRINAPLLYEAAKVIYTFSDSDFGRGYVRCQELHAVDWILETKIKADVLEAVDSNKPYTTFLVDDDVFYRPLHSEWEVILRDKTFQRAYAPRLGRNLNFCWNVDKPQKIGELDFLCKMSVDGHIYRTQDVQPSIESIHFTLVNQIEDQLWDKFHHFELFYPEHSVLVGIPWNRVQNQNPNRYGGGVAKTLNNRYLAGQRINFEKMNFSNVYSAHQLIEYVFE